MLTLPILGTAESYRVRPSKILALGLNYAEHVKESGSLGEKVFEAEIPNEPVVFSITANAICGPGDAIVLPAIAETYGFANVRTDFEGELALVIGKGGKNIREADALHHIFGFTCANDVSQRNIQKSDQSGWFRGKSFDTFLPLGPVIVPRDALSDPHNLSLETRLNGERRQSTSTSDMIFPLPVIISYLSRNFTLEEGDVIITGTPSGVGPLAVGDVVEVEIEGIGTLRNPVAREEAEA
ncbi:MAG: fumarylacetoacetate hydrolase family protein [Spirochaetales bacterium]